MAGSAQKTGRSKPARKRAAKRDLLLDEAARQINAVGAGGVALNDLAETVGLSRNALYYYVADRADLVFRAYQRACEATTDDLVAAEETSLDPARRLQAFIDGQLDYDRPPQAVLNDLDLLDEPQRGLIRAQQQRNMAALQALIAEGVAKGVFRPCETEIAAQSLTGMIAWARLSAGWLGYRDGRATRRRLAAAIGDLMLHGFAARSDADVRCGVDVEALTTKPFNAFDRRQTNEIKITQLIAAASRLFNRRGIDGASLDEISASVGATKGAVYHYFDDKADLVVRCYRRAFELYDAFMDTAVSRGRDGFEKAMICLHLNVQAQAGPLSPLMLQPGRLALPEADREAFTRASQRLRIISNRSLRQGVADGSVRPCDTAFAGEVAAGVFLWLPKWLPQDYPLTPMQVADETTALLAFGLRART